VTAVYDAGYLIAIERGDRIAWAKHALRLQRGELPMTTAPVVAQVRRSARQVQLQRVLRGCSVVDFTATDANDVGLLLAKTHTSDVVDAHVVIVGSRSGAAILTSDTSDIERLARHASPRPNVVRATG
jgi:hypothetical protein